MKRVDVNIAIVLILFLGLMSSCGKDGSFDCLKSTGDIKMESRSLPPFHHIEINDNINLVLSQDTLVNSFEVEAGENLLDGITTTVDHGHLVIRNENTCNWTRKFDVPINIFIRFSQLDTIVYRAAGDVTFLNPWQNDSIQFDVMEGAGTIDLKLDVFKSRIYIQYGVVNVILSGRSDVNFLSNTGYGPVDALNLNTNFTYMNNSSPNDCYVWVRTELGVTIDNIGDVYYKGNPVVNKQLNSSGQLIHLE